jgi:hypothetical protein
MDSTTLSAGARVPARARISHRPPAFDGYPYLVTRIGRCPLRHMAVLPGDWPRERLLDLTRRQAATNRLDTCLCLGPHDAVYVTADGALSEASLVPFGSPVVDSLILAESLPETIELAARRRSLARFAAAHRGSGYIAGDGLEAGRPATAADIERLAGTDASGNPDGLARCPGCLRMRGDFLARKGEGNGDMAARVIRVHCRCENHNLCAGCGAPLAEDRLSSYSWDGAERKVWYQAAYAALSHRCRGAKGR